MDDSGEVKLPQFPALIRAILIDARFSSRGEISRDIQASALFENVEQAPSVQTGLQMLQFQDVDCCFIGPSVTLPTVVDFLKKGREQTRAKDCAFVVILDHEPEEATQLTDAHGVIVRPYTRRKFFEAVIKAVAKANEGGTWATILQAQGGDIFGSSSILISSTTSKESVSPKEISVSVETEIDSGEGEVVGAGSVDLGEAVSIKSEQTERAVGESPGKKRGVQDAISNVIGGEGLKILRLQLDALSVPYVVEKQVIDEAKEVIARFVEAAFAGVVGKPDLIDEFKDYFRISLEEWVIDSTLGSEFEAGEQLRLSLVNWYPGKRKIR